MSFETEHCDIDKSNQKSQTEFSYVIIPHCTLTFYASPYPILKGINLAKSSISCMINARSQLILENNLRIAKKIMIKL